MKEYLINYTKSFHGNIYEDEYEVFADSEDEALEEFQGDDAKRFPGKISNVRISVIQE